MNSILDSLGVDFSTLADTATTFGTGAIASQISGNPYYSNDPAAAGYAVNQTRPIYPGAPAGSTNIVFLVAIGLIIYLVVK